MNINYNTGIPAAANNPSVDQPKMLTNTNAIPLWVGIDHIGFGNIQGGWHNQVTLINQSGVPSSPARTSGMGTLYSKRTSSVSEMFYSPDTTGRQYQLTRTINGSFSLFAQYVNNYPGTNTNYNGGWTFLPGGMLFQYGFVNTGNLPYAIPYPVPFSNVPYSISVTAVGISNKNGVVAINPGSIGTTQFSVIYSAGTSGATGVYWQAIGV